MTTSSPEDAPRGMEFLYNLNRFDLATSRALRCIVIGSPRLLSPECRTPWQMELANALCRYAEISETVGFGSEKSSHGVKKNQHTNKCFCAANRATGKWFVFIV